MVSPQWEKITQSPYILSLIREGYSLEFLSPPPPNFLITCLPRDLLKARGPLGSVCKLAEQEVIIPVPVSQIAQGFYSHVFVVPKPSSKFWVIINLWKLNHYLLYKSSGWTVSIRSEDTSKGESS